MSVSTIRELLVQAEKSFGPEDAIRYKIKKDVTEAKSYTDLREDSEKFSAALAELGAVGEHVAITGMTSYPWIVSFVGAVNSGSVAVPLDVSLPAEEMCELIDRADATVLVLDEIRADVAAIVKARCPKLKALISMQKTERDEQAYSFWQLLEKQEAGYSYEPEPDQLCTIMFTSGTTGKSKGVMLTHRNLAENATCLDMKIPPRTTILSVLPIHHAYCLSMDILKGISLGSIICINDSLLRVAKNIRLFQPDMILMVPLMIETMAKKLEEVQFIPRKLVKAEVFGKKLHTICSGGAYLSPDMIDLFESYGITILQGYGMTECAPVISTNVSWDIRKNSVGKLLPNCEAKVVDKELWVRGSSVMQGYYHMPEETKETLVDGWLRTGDLGYVDEDGFVYLTGRKKNLIITKNGENVSPEELENKIGEARLVQEILVREKEGVIEAEIFPDLDYVKKKRIKNVEEELQKVIDAYNQEAPAYKRVYKLKVREQEFEKTPSKKIKRY
ncbi:MAG: AMP-binding protein [Bariatricus sp.]